MNRPHTLRPCVSLLFFFTPLESSLPEGEFGSENRFHNPKFGFEFNVLDLAFKALQHLLGFLLSMLLDGLLDMLFKAEACIARLVAPDYEVWVYVVYLAVETISKTPSNGEKIFVWCHFRKQVEDV